MKDIIFFWMIDKWITVVYLCTSFQFIHCLFDDFEIKEINILLF